MAFGVDMCPLRTLNTAHSLTDEQAGREKSKNNCGEIKDETERQKVKRANKAVMTMSAQGCVC